MLGIEPGGSIKWRRAADVISFHHSKLQQRRSPSKILPQKRQTAKVSKQLAFPLGCDADGGHLPIVGCSVLADRRVCDSARGEPLCDVVDVFVVPCSQYYCIRTCRHAVAAFACRVTKLCCLQTSREVATDNAVMRYGVVLGSPGKRVTVKVVLLWWVSLVGSFRLFLFRSHSQRKAPLPSCQETFLT